VEVTVAGELARTARPRADDAEQVLHAVAVRVDAGEDVVARDLRRRGHEPWRDATCRAAGAGIRRVEQAPDHHAERR
jgi:hypothetical protein